MAYNKEKGENFLKKFSPYNLLSKSFIKNVFKESFEWILKGKLF